MKQKVRAGCGFVQARIGCLLLLLLPGWIPPSFPAFGADLVPVPELGLRIAPGFSIKLYADSDLANDIYAMTLDADGRVVVTSQGYIKTLLDINGDGRADQFRLFGTTQSGGMGMCFDGNDLYFTGDGFFSVYHDRDANGIADGPPEKILPLHFAEHGGHGVRKGPDGHWYLIGGNETGFNSSNHITLAGSPIRTVEAGAMLRISPTGRESEVIAHGFRNPYDFDFNWLGDIFTYDSDVESDLFLPWYTPTRVYQIAYGGHHGWRLDGWRRSWNRPDYYADAVPILAPIGRGSPTGIVCYRHVRFPEHYRNGLFILDWTFGKIYFLALNPDGASYRAQPELFLEPIGTQGFAPTDAAVAPDGSLFVSIGGRKTRGGVYRIQYSGPLEETGQSLFGVAESLSAFTSVLQAPQPLDAWSRARWMPMAQKLGADTIGQAVLTQQLSPQERVRAIEVLTEMFNGLSAQEARIAARDTVPAIRARVAWSLGRSPCAGFVPILLPLTLDQHPLVRRCALEAIADRGTQLNPTNLLQILPVNLAHPEGRVRQAAARLAARLPEPVWNKLWTSLGKAGPEARLTAALAGVWRNPSFALQTNTLDTALSVLRLTSNPEMRLQAVRLIMLALGDWNIHNPSVEVYSGYELATSLKTLEGMVTRIQTVVRPIFGSNNSWLDAEVARLLGMLEDNDTNLVQRIVARFTPSSYATADFHYLVVLSRLPGVRSSDLTPKVAHAILNLDLKLKGQEERNKQNWSLRLAEVVKNLMNRDSELEAAMLKHPDFPKPAHLGLVQVLDPKHREAAARRYLVAVQNTPRFPWSGPLIELLSLLPPDEVRPLFRQQWYNFGLRDELLLRLAQKPEAIDRDKFLAGLESTQPQAARASLNALLELPRDPSPNHLVPVFQVLRNALSQPKEKGMRTNAIALISKQTGQALRSEEQEADAASLKKTYQPYFDWFAQKHPQLRRALENVGGEDDSPWDQMLRTVNWSSGNPAHGQSIFIERGCQSCHGIASSLGPELGGVASRFSADDLFKAILYPSRDISPLYLPTVFRMRNGETYVGIVSFESADGVIVTTSANTSVRLSSSEIVSREPSKTSLMPTGLLNGLQPQALADLHAYLKTLGSANR